jgi:SOS response regulatory protein OraA/RecX
MPSLPQNNESAARKSDKRYVPKTQEDKQFMCLLQNGFKDENSRKIDAETTRENGEEVPNGS